MNKVSDKWIVSSIIISLLVTEASLLGIFNPLTYSQESTNWTMQAIGQDIGNILATILFITSTYFLRRLAPSAFFIWLGALFYFMYAYLIYAFFVHFNYLFLAYVAVLGLSFYTAIGGLIEQDATKILHSILKKQFRGASVLLIITGGLFALLWLSEIIPALFSGKLPTSVATAGLWVNPIQVIDLAVVLPGMMLTGILLMKKNILGFTFAGPWLTFSILMGSSIVATLLLEFTRGNNEAIIPLIMVGTLVVVSITVLYGYLKNLDLG
jgi:hypothetical protein